jgi:hypothetical protein
MLLLLAVASFRLNGKIDSLLWVTSISRLHYSTVTGEMKKAVFGLKRLTLLCARVNLAYCPGHFPFISGVSSSGLGGLLQLSIKVYHSHTPCNQSLGQW